MRSLNLVAIFLACAWGTSHGVSAQSPEFIGKALFPATMPDRSGLTELLSNGEPHNRMGGISAIDFVGKGDEYYALADRGPDDGDTTYQCRFHTIRIEVDPQADTPVRVELLETCLLSDTDGRNHVGDSRALQATPELGHRLDPEGIRMIGPDQLFICEEYGPMVLQFDRSGRKLGSIPVPSAYGIAKPAATKQDENQNNVSGRASNKGFEGIAVSEDGRTITCIMQNVMLQDGEKDEMGEPHGRNCRLLQIDLDSGKTRQFVFRLDQHDYVLSEILAISSTEFLVIERDWKAGDDAKCKHIKRIDITGATDISDLECLPSSELPEYLHPVSKSTFLDMLDPRYGLAGSSMPEKLEGLTFGPDLADGRKTLIIAADNDFNLTSPSYIYVFGCKIN